MVILQHILLESHATHSEMRGGKNDFHIYQFFQKKETGSCFYTASLEIL